MFKIIKFLLVIIILAIGGVFIYMNTAFKSDAAAYASKITGTNVSITAVTLNPLEGTVSLRGLDIGNPKGFESKNAIEFGSIYSNVELKSLLTDKIVINEVSLRGANIYYELKGNQDNIRKLMNNIKSNSSKISSGSGSSGSSDSGSKSKPKDFVIKKLNVTDSSLVLAAKLFELEEDKTLEVNDIHLTNVTKSNSKAVAKQLSNQLIAQITQALIKEKADKYINKYGDKLKNKLGDKIGGKIGGKLGDLF